MADSARNVVWCTIEDEAMMLDASSGDSFSLNRVATDVWLLIQEHVPTQDIVTRISTKYGVDRTTVETDVVELLAELRATRLLES